MKVSHLLVGAGLMAAVTASSTNASAQQQPAGGFNAQGQVRVGEGAAPSDPNRLPTSRSDHDAAPPVAAVDLPRGGIVSQAGIGGEVAYGRPGVVELGGNMGLTIASDYKAFNISPTVGWFFANNIQLSGILNLQYSNNNGVGGTYFSLLAEPSYHLPINRSLFAFLGLGVGIGYNDGVGFALAPRLGLNIMIGRSGILSPALQYTYTTQSVTSTAAGTLVNGGSQFGINVGYTIML